MNDRTLPSTSVRSRLYMEKETVLPMNSSEGSDFVEERMFFVTIRESGTAMMMGDRTRCGGAMTR
jgi:hypothetical protein